MNPHSSYKISKANAWTRIDMLLLIYERTIEALDQGIEIIESGDLTELVFTRMEAQKRILLITDGLDVDSDSTAVHILNLCVFILDQINSDELEKWKSSLELIETLHQGFQAIADEARELERNGKIPQLQM